MQPVCMVLEKVEIKSIFFKMCHHLIQVCETLVTSEIFIHDTVVSNHFGLF